VFAENIAPQVRQVRHTPRQPRSGQEVTITAKGGTGIVAQIFGGFGKQGSNNPSERERLDEASVIDVPVSEEK